MLGYLHLRLSEYFLEMADAQFPFGQKIQDPKPGQVTKALIDLDESHGVSSTFPHLHRIRNQSE
jgi:hypothetical protein